jgi:adenosylcobyric acid synthase
VLPWLEHGLPDEDGASPTRHTGGRFTVAVVRYPTASNLDEFKALEQVAGVQWVNTVHRLNDADLLVLPGSKHVAADLAWLIRSGLAEARRERTHGGRRVLGICGGLQMLGERIEDPAGVDGSAEGLGLLRTTFRSSKQTARISTRFSHVPEPWSALSSKPLNGYEIRHGESMPTAAIVEALPNGRGFVAGSVLGVYPHGLFEQPELVAALAGKSPTRTLDQVFDELADAVESNLDVSALLEAVGIR